MNRGFYVGVMPIDALVDFVFATRDVAPTRFLTSLQRAADAVKNIEASTWIYKHAEELKNES